MGGPDPHGLIDQKAHGHYASTPGNGEGALDDLSSYEFSLCEFCLDFLFSNFKIPPVEIDRLSKDAIEFKPAAQKVKEDEWRRQKEKFF